MDIFPKRLKKLRESKKALDSKFTQGYIADLIGVARTTYTAYENGTKQPPMETINKIADLFEVSTDYLLGRTDKQEPNDDDKLYEEYMNDPEFQYAMRSAHGFSEENKSKVIDYIKMINELEKGRKPGDRQPRIKKRR
ncbi:helix-turn-helix domain-containing protein [Bacillus sp. JJ722]|uniref:helix-turn-helix domain-containing protein n=1 Tax=Bacillus sp. JJ722 TaxID=3122973 RepID=UPI002FFE437C